MSNGTVSRLRDLERRVANMIRLGTIAVLDEENARASVKIGGVTTVPLPWLTHRAGPDVTWWAPEPGEQVAVLSPGGIFNHAVILPAVFQNAFTAPAASKNLQVTRWADGSSLTYDRAAHKWALNVPDSAAEVKITTGGKVTVIADGDVSVTTAHEIKLVAAGKITLSGSQIDITGPVTANSTITAAGDVIAAGISLDHHKHGGVSPGIAQTTEPV